MLVPQANSSLAILVW